MEPRNMLWVSRKTCVAPTLRPLTGRYNSIVVQELHFCPSLPQNRSVLSDVVFVARSLCIVSPRRHEFVG